MRSSGQSAWVYFPHESGAAPNFLPALVIAASKLARAFFQASPLMGTAQLPFPLQSLTPSPPWFLQAFEPAQPWASAVAHLPWPAHSLSPPAPLPLQEFR